ncbi:MAG: CARDB domain-containing protein [Anaerolineae bacterium]|jgi:hypothetical protein
MKRTTGIVVILTLVAAVGLLVLVAPGLAQEDGPVPDARPTPTPELPLPPIEPPPEGPDAPEIPPLPDLIVEDIEVIPAVPVIGQEVIVRVTIANQSNVDVTPGNNFWSDLYVDPAVVPIQLGQDGQAAWPCQATWVPAGGSYVLEATYTFDDVKVFALWAQVDTDGHVVEANEHNNVLGPVSVQVLGANTIVHASHRDFQMGLASTLDASHSEGVIRPGLFIEPWTDPEIYSPDSQVDDPPLPPAPPSNVNVNQVKPALASDGNGHLFAVWEDGRNGGVYNRDIYYSYSDDGGQSWGPDILVHGSDTTGNQVSADIAYDQDRNRVYAVWQDERDGNFDIYFAYSDNAGTSWTELPSPLNDDSGTANQLNPAIAVGKHISDTQNHVYVVWQDRRNGNDDIYLAHSDDGGDNWDPNYFVTDDPEMTLQNQVAPAVSVENLFGIVIVGWEDWRDAEQPEIYTMWSLDHGQTFGIDVPVTVIDPDFRTTYRLAPDLEGQTTIEWVEREDPLTGLIYYVPVPVTVIHVAWQDWETGDPEIYYSFATFDWEKPDPCPVPYDYCFQPPQQVSGYELPSDYVEPPTEPDPWPLEPAWQGDVSLDIVPDVPYYDTLCLLESSEVYSRGVMIAWSDARSYDEWRHEIHVRRTASRSGEPKSFVVCERPRDVGMVNSNAKLHAYRDDLTQYDFVAPAAARQSNPYIVVDEQAVYVTWDDDRWDEPLAEVPGLVDRDIFAARMGITTTGAYVSPVIDSRGEETLWYVLSWWAATDHRTDVLFQTRFGNSLNPPQEDVAANGWTRWTGNPGSTYLGCTAGVGCYYDAPGRHMVGPTGEDWFGGSIPGYYRYMQYKIIMEGTSRWTALSEVTIHYKGPQQVYLPVVFRNYQH